MLIEILFLGSVGVLAYIYLGYPLLVRLLAWLRPRRVRRRAIEPSITILIAAYDERDVIESTLRNKLELDYSMQQLRIIVVSDGSTDGTNDIVRSFDDPRVRLIVQEERRGKTMALNRGVAAARGEIVVFSDANSLFARDALRRLVESFADSEVGYVTGKMVYTDPTGTRIGDGCSAYMRYENRLREWETQLGSIVGVDGGIDAIRRTLYRPMQADQLPDLVLPLSVVERGYRVVYEPRALLGERALESSGDEYRMRVRVALRALWALHDMRGMLNVFRHGLFAWQLFSHKILRYSAFLFLLFAFVANLAIWDRHPVWTVSFLLQILCYLAVISYSLLGRRRSSIRALYLPYYFTLINLASAHAFLKYVSGRKQVLWTPRKG